MTPSAALRRLGALNRNLRPVDGGAPPAHLPSSVVVAPTAAAMGERGWDMSEQELYMFDTMGFLRVRNMISPQQVAECLASAREGIDSGSLDHTSMAPKGQHVGGDFYVNAFLYSKVIERIAYTPKLLDYACHVLNNQPRLSEQILMCQDETHPMHNFHLRKDSPVQIREDGPRFYTDAVNRRVYMDHVSFFVYLTDVQEGDGGLCVVPGSHKSAFKYPGGEHFRTTLALGKPTTASLLPSWACLGPGCVCCSWCVRNVLQPWC